MSSKATKGKPHEHFTAPRMVKPVQQRPDALAEEYGQTNHGTRDRQYQLRHIKRRGPDGKAVDRTEADKIIMARFGRRFEFYAATAVYFVYQEVRK